MSTRESVSSISSSSLLPASSVSTLPSAPVSLASPPTSAAAAAPSSNDSEVASLASPSPAPGLPLPSPSSGPFLIPDCVSGIGANQSSVSSYDSFGALLTASRTLLNQSASEVSPYVHKYEARHLLQTAEKELKRRANDYRAAQSAAQLQESEQLIGICQYWLGINYVETEEPAFGECALSAALNALQSDELRHALELTDAFNQLAILWSKRGWHRKSYAYLQRAQQLYHRVKKYKPRHESQQSQCQTKQTISTDTAHTTALQHISSAITTATDSNRDQMQMQVFGGSQTSASDPALGRVRTELIGTRTDSYESGSGIFAVSNWATLESCHTLTLFYLAQVLQALNKNDLSASYCLLTLNRQLMHTDFDAVKGEWIRNAIDLSSYFNSQRRFEQAHHCLTAAQSFMKNHFPIRSYSKAEDLTKEDELSADIARGWAQFYLSWMKFSRQQFVERREHELTAEDKKAVEREAHEEKTAAEEKQQNIQRKDETENVELDGKTSAEEDDMRKLEEKAEEEREERVMGKSADTFQSSASGLSVPCILFRSLNLPAVPPIEAALTVHSARQIFVSGQKWIHSAMRAYRYDGWVTDFIPLAQEESQMYKLLAFFYGDIGDRCKLLKRRIDLLAPIQSTLSASAYLEFYQQITDEIAGVYMEMAELKHIQNRENSGKDRLSAQEKINGLALKSVHYYEMWIKTFEKKETDSSLGAMSGNSRIITPQSSPSSFDPSYRHCYLNAHFYIARMYSKVYPDDRKALLGFLQKALSAYKTVVELVQIFKQEKDYEKELEVCQEMVNLLPMKMDKIVAHGAFQE